MEDKRQIYQALLKETDQLISKVEKYDGELATEIRVILRMMQRYIPQNDLNPETERKISESISKVAEAKLIRPSQLIRKVFKENPYTEYSPGQLRDILKEVKKRGELVIRGKNLLVTTHTVIRMLRKNNFIERIEKSDGIPVYRKKQN